MFKFFATALLAVGISTLVFFQSSQANSFNPDPPPEGTAPVEADGRDPNPFPYTYFPVPGVAIVIWEDRIVITDGVDVYTIYPNGQIFLNGVEIPTGSPAIAMLIGRLEFIAWVVGVIMGV